MVYILRNYNKFLVGNTESFGWRNFYIHRWEHDFDKLVQFDSQEAAQAFLNQHPEIEAEFDAWIVEGNRESWNDGQFAAEQRRKMLAKLADTSK